MFHNQRGSIYRVILAVIIAVAFCFALLWPQYSKRHQGKRLSQMADLGRALAFAEESYKQQYGHYTPLFKQLDLPLPCPMVTNGQGPHLDCPDYTFQLLEEGVLRISHKQLPVWLEVDVPQGTVQCNYADNDWAGQDLCARMQ